MVRGEEVKRIGRPLGQAEPFSKEMAQTLRRILAQREDYRGLALFNLHIDTALRASDVLKLRVSDVASGAFYTRQKKTGRVVKCELSSRSKSALKCYLPTLADRGGYLFPSPRTGGHLTTHWYQRLVKRWEVHLRQTDVKMPSGYISTHSMRRTKVTHLTRMGVSARACQLILDHASLSSTEKYLNLDVQEALDRASRHPF